MPATTEQITDALRQVQDPDLHRDLVTLGMVKDIAIEAGLVRVHVELTTPACPMKEKIEADVRAAVLAVAGVDDVEVKMTANVKASPQQQAQQDNPLPGVKNIIAVGAGKGGVGKSTVAVNLAVALAREGAAVGLLDGDIYGPSLPTLLDLDHIAPRTTQGNMIVPFEVHGILAMTIGKLVESEKPLIWRGPMAHGAFRQLTTQTQWGELDYLIIDLPPGTGDVPLTMSQLLPLTGAVVVCTPQKVAQDDARRAVRMFEQLDIDVLGIVENMSYFIGDDGKEYDIFGRGGAEAMAASMGVHFLGSVAISMALRANCDAGEPLKNFEAGGQLADELTQLARNVAAQVSIAAASAGGAPTLSIT